MSVYHVLSRRLARRGLFQRGSGLAALALIACAFSSSEAFAQRCIQGYVWREVTRNDHVCVTPATRQQISKDNAQIDARRQPGGGAYGPETCRQGYVWREAVHDDRTCVAPQTRDQARSDNAQASRRVQSQTID